MSESIFHKKGIFEQKQPYYLEGRTINQLEDRKRRLQGSINNANTHILMWKGEIEDINRKIRELKGCYAYHVAEVEKYWENSIARIRIRIKAVNELEPTQVLWDAEEKSILYDKGLIELYLQLQSYYESHSIREVIFLNLQPSAQIRASFRVVQKGLFEVL